MPFPISSHEAILWAVAQSTSIMAVITLGLTCLLYGISAHFFLPWVNQPLRETRLGRITAVLAIAGAVLLGITMIVLFGISACHPK